jgi:hypothetical protein
MRTLEGKKKGEALASVPVAEKLDAPLKQTRDRKNKKAAADLAQGQLLQSGAEERDAFVKRTRDRRKKKREKKTQQTWRSASFCSQ